jgi:general secretion pathway protein I
MHMRRARGFTLIEVLAALVIVAFGMLAAIEAVNQSARNGTYLRDKTLAHWIALNVVTERRLAESPPDVAESEGKVDYGGEQWRWSMKVTQTQVESMRRMDVSVRKESAREGSSLATVSGFYGSAVGAAGGGTLNWSGQGGPGMSGQDTDDQGGAGTPVGNGKPPNSNQNNNKLPYPNQPPSAGNAPPEPGV